MILLSTIFTLGAIYGWICGWLGWRERYRLAKKDADYWRTQHQLLRENPAREIIIERDDGDWWKEA
jgi:uncharacterized membrane protein YciS (DUF1049 family)